MSATISSIRGRAGLASVAVVSVLAATACAPAQVRSTGSAPAVPSGSDGAGPRPRQLPPAAVVAESSQQLHALLADPAGPREIWLRGRRYEGDFRIARELVLRGASGATLEGTGHGTVLRIEADGASVENLVVRHSGRRYTAEDAGIKAKGERIRIRDVRVEDSLFGVALGPCPRCEVERVHVQGTGEPAQAQGDGIKLWESDHAIVRGCLVEGMRDVVVWYSRHVLLESNTVRGSRYGSHFMYAHDSVVRDSDVEGNVVGIFVMYSARLRVEHNVLAGARGAAGVGLGFKDSDGVTVAGNWIVANTTGTYLDGTPRSAGQPVAFVDNTFALNDVALRFHGTLDALRFTANEFGQNGSLVEVEGGGDALAVAFARNHYSDYVGYDLDRDGVGDVAHQVKRLSRDLIDAHPSLSFFSGTVGLGLIDAVANAMPVFASRVLLEDREPVLAARRLP